jgi:head-tail adaptor
MSFELFLTQKAIIYKGVVTPDAYGEERVVWTFVQQLPCLVRPIKPYTFTKLGVEETVTHEIIVPFGTSREVVEQMVQNIRGNWRIDTVEDLFGVNQRTYRVIEAYDPAYRRHHLEIRVRRLEEGFIGIVVSGISSSEAFGIPTRQ